jgi:hypothetical protein
MVAGSNMLACGGMLCKDGCHLVVLVSSPQYSGLVFAHTVHDVMQS